MLLYILRIGVNILDLIISFFRDVLDGPLYTGVAIVCGILICSCIGYLGERYLKKQEAKKEYEATHAAIAGETVDVSSLTNAPASQSVAAAPVVNNSSAQNSGQ